MARGESSTVARAIELLELLSKHPEGMSITNLTEALDTQRSPLYRILRALESGNLVRRDNHKAYRLSFGLIPLAAAASGPLESSVEPALATLADETNCAALVVVAAGDDLITALCVTPRAPGLHVITPIGFVHPRTRVASRIAIEVGCPAMPEDPDDVVEARARGWSVTGQHEADRLVGVAAPVDIDPIGNDACLLLLTRDHEVLPEAIAVPLVAAARELSSELGGR